jgi:hypothetical protein
MRTQKMVRLFFCVVSCVLALAASLLAQGTMATVTGRVFDPGAAVIVEATLTATNVDTGIETVVKTNEQGLYQFADLGPGNYAFSVSKPGFKLIVKPGVTLHVADTISMNFNMQVGAASETVTVEGGTPLVNTESAAVSTVVDRQFVENIPLNGRSFQSLIATVPGVTVAAGARQGQEGEFSVNGQRTEANYYMVDGVSANTGVIPGGGLLGVASGQFPGQTALGTTQSLVSIDAMEEFRINTSSYSAEYGRTPGAQISIQTRSGKNQRHGSAFDYFRNNEMDANNWFNNAAGIGRPAERQNDFGGTFGGPVLIPGVYQGKDRTFFFFSYEGVRLQVPQAAVTQWVPDSTLRSTAPVALQPVLNAFPLPNGPEQTSDMALFTSAYSTPSSLNATGIRIDQMLGSKWRLFGRFADTPSYNITRNLANPERITYNIKTLTAGATAVLSPQLSNDFRFNATWNNSSTIDSSDNFGGATPLQLSSTPLAPGYTTIVLFLVGTTPLIEERSNESLQRQINVVDTFTAVHGAHILKYGFDYRRVATDNFIYLLDVGYLYFGLSDILSNTAPMAPASSWGSTPSDLIFSNYSAFVQDEWKATRRLHLSLGLRWDVNPPPVNGSGPPPYNLDQVTNLATAKLAPQGTPMWKTDYHGFAPRLGATYLLHQSPAHQTVLRGGFGLFYDMGTNYAGAGLAGVGFGTTTTFSNVSFPLTAQQLTLPPPSIAAPYNAEVTATDQNLVLPRVWEWNLSLEQGLGSNQAITVSYLGAAGRDLLTGRYYDLSSVNPNFSLGNGLNVDTNGSASDYDALQVQFQRRLSHGLQALASYTWAHSLDDLSGNNSPTTPPLRGNSDFDIRHTFSAAATYSLPGRYTSRLAEGALGGWSLDTRIIGRSALPFIVTSGTIFLSGMQQASLIPDVVAGVPFYISDSAAPGGRRVNPAAFQVPPAGQQGNEPRNFLRGFDLWQTDLALRKEFPLHERLKLQFRAEAFNLFNRPNFGAIQNSTTAGPALFGRATGLLSTQLGDLNPLYQTGGPRSLQLALKLIF